MGINTGVNKMTKVSSGYTATYKCTCLVICIEKYTQNGTSSNTYSKCYVNGSAITAMIDANIFGVHHSDGAYNGMCKLQIYSQVLNIGDKLTVSVVCNPSYSTNYTGSWLYVS